MQPTQVGDPMTPRTLAEAIAETPHDEFCETLRRIAAVCTCTTRDARISRGVEAVRASDARHGRSIIHGVCYCGWTGLPDDFHVHRDTAAVAAYEAASKPEG